LCRRRWGGRRLSPPGRRRGAPAGPETGPGVLGLSVPAPAPGTEFQGYTTTSCGASNRTQSLPQHPCPVSAVDPAVRCPLAGSEPTPSCRFTWAPIGEEEKFVGPPIWGPGSPRPGTLILQLAPRPVSQIGYNGCESKEPRDPITACHVPESLFVPSREYVRGWKSRC